MNVANYLPFLQWISSYNKNVLGNDLIAGLIVTVMLIPQSLAYAMLAGLPPVVGLYASITPLLVYAVLGTSRTLSVGPVAVVSLMTAAAVSQIATPGSAEYASAAVLLAFISGVFLFILGLLRLGFLANLLSHPVISGFITASGILIAISQLKHIFGVEAQGHNLISLIQSLWLNVLEVHLPTVTIGFIVIMILLYSRTALQAHLRARKIPAGLASLFIKIMPALVIVISSALVAILGLDAAGVKVVGDIPAGLPIFTLPSTDFNLWYKLLPAAALISVIGYVESVSVGQTLAAKRRQRIDPDQELIGLGASNVAAAVSGGLPVTGGFSRSVVNYDAGAQTPIAGVFAAGLIAISTLFFTGLFKYLPIVTLGATIIIAVLSLIDIGSIKRYFRYSKSDFAAMMLTIIVTLGKGVEAGIISGVIISLLLHLWRTSRPHIAVIGRVEGTEHYRNKHRHNVVTNNQILSLRVDESLYFANARFLENAIYQLIAENGEVKHVILLCSAVNEIDGSALESLESISEKLMETGVTLHLSEVKGPVTDRLRNSNFIEYLTGEIFLSHHAAVSSIEAKANSRPL